MGLLKSYINFQLCAYINVLFRLHNLVTSRQQDKQTAQTLERKLQEEKKQRTSFEQQLANEKKKKADEAAKQLTPPAAK